MDCGTNQGQGMRNLLFVCSLLVVVVGLGVVIGFFALPVDTAEKAVPWFSGNEPKPVAEKATPAAEQKARIYLRGLAVVDLPRLVAAHPWTAAHEQSFARKLS